MLRYIEYVYAVYKAGSFSAAADNLFLSQPCLSAMVKKAEEQLGVPIFNRKAKPISLTEYGRQYISCVEKIYDAQRELEQYLNDAQDLRAGILRVGANNIFASYVLPGLIHEFNKLYPGVQIQMTEGNISYLEESLTAGKIDLVLDNHPMDSDLFLQHILGREHLLLAMHNSLCRDIAVTPASLTCHDILEKRHLRANTPAVSVGDFAHLPFVALREGNDTRYRMDTLFSAAGESPKIQLEVDQLATAYNIACSKVGATLVSDTLIYKAPPNPEMAFYRLEDATAVRPIFLYYKHSRYVSLTMQKFLAVADLFFSQASPEESKENRCPPDIPKK